MGVLPSFAGGGGGGEILTAPVTYPVPGRFRDVNLPQRIKVEDEITASTYLRLITLVPTHIGPISAGDVTVASFGPGIAPMTCSYLRALARSCVLPMTSMVTEPAPYLPDPPRQCYLPSAELRLGVILYHNPHRLVALNHVSRNFPDGSAIYVTISGERSVSVITRARPSESRGTSFQGWVMPTYMHGQIPLEAGHQSGSGRRLAVTCKGWALYECRHDLSGEAP